MNDWWPYLSFVLGAFFALALQWVSYKLGVKKEKDKEFWIRILNSYQDFYQNCMQILNIKDQYKPLRMPPQKDTQSFINAARKAAYDAVYFDDCEQSRQMLEIVNEIAYMTTNMDEPSDELLAKIESYKKKIQIQEKSLFKYCLKSVSLVLLKRRKT